MLVRRTSPFGRDGMTYDEASTWAAKVTGFWISRDTTDLPDIDALRLIAKRLELRTAVIPARALRVRRRRTATTRAPT